MPVKAGLPWQERPGQHPRGKARRRQKQSDDTVVIPPKEQGEKLTAEYYLTMYQRVFGLDEGDVLRSSLDNKATEQGLGWRPKTDVDEGLKRTYDYFLNRA